MMYNDYVFNTTEHVTHTMATRSTAEIAIAAIFLSCIIVTSIIGNVAVIYAILKNESLRDHISNLFIMNLSITDLSSAAIVMSTSLVTLIHDVTDVNVVWCNFACAANYCLIIVSMLTLAFIGIDRYIAVIHSLKYQTLVTSTMIYVMIAYTWLQGVTFAIVPVALHWNHYDYWEVICAVDWSHETVVYYVIIACTMCFLLPGATMVFCYTHVIRQAKKCSAIQAMPTNSYKLETTAQQSGQKPRRATTRMTKTITSLLIVVVLFFVFMTPFCMTKFLKVVMTHPGSVPPYANLVASFFAYLSSVINPFVYGIFRADFRNAYRRIFRQIWWCQNQPACFETNSSYTTRRNSEMWKTAVNNGAVPNKVSMLRTLRAFSLPRMNNSNNSGSSSRNKTKVWSSTHTMQVQMGNH